MTESIKIEPPKAFLEHARSLINVKILAPSDEKVPDDSVLPSGLIFASIAQTYIFSYLSVLAFVTENVSGIWKEKKSDITNVYPNAQSVEHLFNSDLKEVKEALKFLCSFHKIKPIHEAEPILWNDFLQVVKTTRDFFSHPIPDEHKFDKIVGDAFTKHNWQFASSIAVGIISYFYSAKNLEIPNWLKENQDFKIESIRALRVIPSSKTG